MKRDFGGVIWTNHALERLRERGIKQGDAWAAWRNPDQTRKGARHKSKEAWRYYRRFGDQIIEVVAQQNERREWIILSVWSRPAYDKKPPKFKKTTSDKDPIMLKLLKKIFGVH